MKRPALLQTIQSALTRYLVQPKSLLLLALLASGCAQDASVVGGAPGLRFTNMREEDDSLSCNGKRIHVQPILNFFGSFSTSPEAPGPASQLEFRFVGERHSRLVAFLESAVVEQHPENSPLGDYITMFWFLTYSPQFLADGSCPTVQSLLEQLRSLRVPDARFEFRENGRDVVTMGLSVNSVIQEALDSGSLNFSEPRFLVPRFYRQVFLYDRLLMGL